MSGSMVEIKNDDSGNRTGYLAEPSDPNGRGIVLLYEAYGLHDDMKSIADDYAAAGYTVLVPDLFWKKGENVTFDYADRQAAGDTFREIGGFVSYLEDVDPALNYLKSKVSGPVALMGFGLGGITAFNAAAQGKGDAAVSFFPAMIDVSQADNFDKPWQYHYAGKDEIAKAGIYQDTSAAFSSNDKVEIEEYPEAQHGFTGPKRDEYDQSLAKQAYDKTIAFLDRHLS